MKRLSSHLLPALLLFLCLIAPLGATQSAPLGDGAILEILRERVDNQRKAVGIVVGLVDQEGSRIISYGTYGKEDERQVDGDTLFEMASNTKIFTSLLLMEMVGRGEVTLLQPAADFLPEGVRMPRSPAREITLLHLSTHTSGLPRWPDNMGSPATYTVQDLHDFLNGYELEGDVGTRFQYSNLGVGLLGHLLASRAGKSYESLFLERIAKPLDMSSTKISLTAEDEKRLARGHSAAGDPAPPIAIKTLEGGGALYSTANDLLAFLKASLGLTETHLATALREMHEVRAATNDPDVEMGLGWFILERPQSSISYHTGGSAGYRSFIGLDVESRRGVVVLSNVDASPDDIGFHILDNNLPLAAANRRAIRVDPALFDSYVGEYQLSPASVITISRTEDTLMIQMTGTRQGALAAESETEYFLTGFDIQVRFIRNQDGIADSLELIRNGRANLAIRVR